ncbi:PQQ-dependent sugar dehydrogenase [Pedobacter metabolipauper]|uniref:Glucose/sorbosone dehydrogenase n=1 Tax=Pedobacter metabolipauper TaxID=425513 RepID=A0A4R6T341_9SPHI|nr:PQQ-dependent sugar dehydrogenase [Pedobacter metabolipauper]TDQ11791.1 glucose/sorbosone dehydrogenase [Pedobacter metabolipauper]
MSIKSSLKALTTALLIFSSAAMAQVPASPIKLKLKLISDKFTSLTAFAEPNDKTGRLFVVEQEGRIKIIKKGILLTTPFLDIQSEVLKGNGSDERGLLGLAFHPEYSKNGKFYIYYSSRIPKTAGVNHHSIVREFTASSQNSDLADKASGRIVLEFEEPEANHNGGDLKFGPDGFLYVAVGDGGGGDDRHAEFGNGQNLNTFLGKILRIDVNQKPYAVPKDNPFVGKANTKPEIYAYGLRNPWRISFDKVSGKLFVGDVGQNKYEEIDIVTKGGNYGWRIREGLHENARFPNDPDPKNSIDPITDYPHAEGISVTGGFVYRGKKIPALYGKYVFADWMGPLWTLTDTKKPQWNREKLSISHDAGYWQITSFGEDQAGELYLLAAILESGKNAVYQIIP